jgi:hypothetical protein
LKILRDFLGRRVRLTDERAAHILDHPEMRDFESALAGMLRAPELVVESVSDESVLLCYRFVRATMVGDKWLCVVVKYRMEGAFVLTAYLTDKPKKGKQLWPRE